MIIQSWTDVLVTSFQNMWGGVAAFLPAFLGALIVFVVGLVIASAVGSLVERVLETLKLNNALKTLAPHVERAGLSLNAPRFFGQLVFWFFFLVFLLAASDILKLFALSSFLRDVLNYIPNIVVAVLIMVAALLVANLLRRVVEASAASAKLHNGKFFASLAWWAVSVFGFLAALVQLGVAVSLINTLITGFVAMLAIAGGIAFGLGGKDVAAQLLGKLRDQVGHRGHQ